MITPGNLFLTAVIVVLVVGSKKIRHLGEDLGVAIKNFKEAMNNEKKAEDSAQTQEKKLSE